MEKNLVHRIKKVHVSVPEDLFNELRETGLLWDIDNVVTEFLAEKVTEIRKKEGRWVE